MQVWINGRMLPSEQARISVVDHGFTVGDGVFETLRVVRGTTFAPTRHLRRLQRSVQVVGLPDPDPGIVRAAIADVVDANAGLLGDHGRVRVTYTSGDGPAGSDRGPGPCTLVVFATPGIAIPSPTAVRTVPWPRNERAALAGVKSTSYSENAIALAWAKARGATEAVLGNTSGQLCEGTGTNVLLVRDGEVVTPPLSSGCLAGITRELVLEWFGVREAELSMQDLAEADEVLLTSSTRDVQQVSRVDARGLGAAPIGASLAARFIERAMADLDP